MTLEGHTIERNQEPNLPSMPSIELGLYRHYKGGEYEVLGVVRHSETLEPLVLYRPIYSQAGMWIRPFFMFFELVDFNGKTQPRFSKITTIQPVSD